MSLADIFARRSRGGGGSGDGAAEVELHTAGKTLTADDMGKFHYVNSASPTVFHLPEMTADLVGQSIWFYKAAAGTIDINAFDEADGTDDIEEEYDVENTTTETMASIHLKCTAAGSLSIIGVVGSWQ